MATAERDRQVSQASAWAIRLGGILWISTLAYFVGQAIAQTAWKTPYSLVNNPISDLGIATCGTWPPPGAGSRIAARLGSGHGYLCSPLHEVMNVAFVLTGVLLLLGLYLTRGEWPRRLLTSWGFAFLALAGLGKIAVGVFPENVLIPHAVGGFVGIPSGNVAMVLLGLAVIRDRRWVGILSIALGGIGLLAWPAGSLGVLSIGQGTGAAERISDYPLIVWMVVLGISFVRSSRPDQWGTNAHNTRTSESAK